MSAPTNDLVPLLKKLRLSGVLETLELRVRQAAEDELAYGEFLVRLLAAEVERREAKQLWLRLRRANFEQEKTIGDFDFGFNPRVPKARVIDLATCAFVPRKVNVCLLGPAGTGKTHIAHGECQDSCRPNVHHAAVCFWLRASLHFFGLSRTSFRLSHLRVPPDHLSGCRRRAAS